MPDISRSVRDWYQAACCTIGLCLACAAGGGTPGTAGANATSEDPQRLARNWIANGSVDPDSSGWHSRVPEDGGTRALWEAHSGRGGTAAFHLSSPRRDTLRNYGDLPVWVFRLDSVPCGHRMRFQAWARGRDCTLEPVLGVQVYRSRTTLPAVASTEGKSGLSGTYDWTRLEGTVDVPEDAIHAKVGAFLVGGGDVWFDDFSLSDLGPLPQGTRSAFQTVAADSGHLFLVRSEERVVDRAATALAAGSGPRAHLRIALPFADRHQIPVGFELWTEPPASLVSSALIEDQPGNFIADLVLALPRKADAGLSKWQTDGVLVKWMAQVIVPPEGLSPLPARAAFPAEWPAEARPWLRPTRCAQSDDPQILAIAEKLRTDTNDVYEIIQRTLTYMERIQDDLREDASVFDAVTALSRSGSCISQANLAVALLRASGIPARIFSGFATWAGPHQIHFVVEAWVPSHGWYRIEPTRFQAPWPASGLVTVSLVTAEAEDRGAPRRPTGVACLPYLAVEEVTEGCPECTVIGTLDATTGSGHLVTRLRSFGPEVGPERWRDALMGARDEWRKWLASRPQTDRDGHLRAPFDADRLQGLLHP